jgi:hypothetical protein
MQDRKYLFGLSGIPLVILIGAAVKFAIHLYYAPGYGFFFDELYTIALSRHLAFGYVDLPPLVPALVALSRAVLGGSLFATHIVPALAGSATLVLVCLITKEFGGKTFAVALSALAFLVVPLWLVFDSFFCYDSIDQLVLAGFLYVLARFLRTGDKRLWIALGLIAGIACMTKMTILFLGPGFLAALLASTYRKDLITPWPWIGGALCLIIAAPYLLWQSANHWPTLEYWTNYGTVRVYRASIQQYFTNILVYMSPLLLPLWIVGLARIFRRFHGVNYGFFGLLFLITLILMFLLHASVRMLAVLFIPLLAAAAVFLEDFLAGTRWKHWMNAAAAVYLLAVGIVNIPISLPVVPMDQLLTVLDPFKPFYQSLREFNGAKTETPVFLSGRMGWDELVRGIAEVYDQLPAEDRAVVGIYADGYPIAGAIDMFGPSYGLPHAVSGSLTYYLWGPGYSWDTMIIVNGRSNNMSVFFNECEKKGVVSNEYSAFGDAYLFVCRKPKVPADAIWGSLKDFR